MVKTVKISDENYRWLSKIAGRLQQEFGEPVSIDRALLFVHKSKHLTDLAGSWKIPAKQMKKQTADVRYSWAGWRERIFSKKGKK